MRIDNRRVEKLERVSRTRKIEQTEQENEEDRSDNFNSSLAYMQKQRQKSESTRQEEDKKEDKVKKDRTISDINIIKAQMEGNRLGKINMLREKLNNQIHEPEKPKEEVEKPEVKRARKAYEESMKMAEELER